MPGKNCRLLLCLLDCLLSDSVGRGGGFQISTVLLPKPTHSPAARMGEKGGEGREGGGEQTGSRASRASTLSRSTFGGRGGGANLQSRLQSQHPLLQHVRLLLGQLPRSFRLGSLVLQQHRLVLALDLLRQQLASSTILLGKLPNQAAMSAAGDAMSSFIHKPSVKLRRAIRMEIPSSLFFPFQFPLIDASKIDQAVYSTPSIEQQDLSSNGNMGGSGTARLIDRVSRSGFTV